MGIIDASGSSLKLRKLDEGRYIFAVSCPTKADGTLFNPEKEEKSHSSGRLYTTTFVRHWDTWITLNRNSIWYGNLSRSSGPDNTEWSLSSLVNALKDTGLECPIPPFGSGDNFDLGTEFLVFVAKDPDLNPAFNTKSNVYLLKLTSITSGKRPAPIKVDITGFNGASSSPVFSPDGKQVVFLSMRKNGYESDRNHIFLITDIYKPKLNVEVLSNTDFVAKWDRSPSSLTWSQDGREIYLVAENKARSSLFSLPTTTSSADSGPKLLFQGSGVGGKSFSSFRYTITCWPDANRSSDVQVIQSGIFLSCFNLVDSSAYYLISSDGSCPRLLSSVSQNGFRFGLSHNQISEIYFPGAASNTSVQAWVIKPSTFKKGEKYPLAYLIHGGPQGAWTDSWSTRWNPAVFAEQGYVVITPNPTGSTGFGQAFTDAIQEQWGGLPYQDLVNGFEYIEKHLDFVDTSHAVALGASYGGYMMNWIQGMPLGRKFKALVTHDGVFSMAGQMSSDEMYFPEHEFGGKFWKNQKKWLQFDPSNHLDKWNTPHLIIHSEKDYRLTMSEGLAAFNVLQERGVDSQFLTFPDENHWVLKPENSLLWHTVVLDFVNPKVGLPSYSSQNDLAKKLKEKALCSCDVLGAVQRGAP